MIFAVDTCVLIDILEPDPVHGAASRDALRTCLQAGSVVACEVVWAEVATAYAAKSEKLLEALSELGLGYSPMTREASLASASRWHRFRKGGGGRDRIVADFLIGGHALTQCDRLLTRDRDFFSRSFRGLELADHPALSG